MDTGSIHNFLNPSIIAMAQLPVYHTTGLLVNVANGEALHSDRITKKFLCHMQGINFHTNFYVLILGGYDVILGFQWLKTLEPIYRTSHSFQLFFHLRAATSLFKVSHLLHYH